MKKQNQIFVNQSEHFTHWKNKFVYDLSVAYYETSFEIKKNY